MTIHHTHTKKAAKAGYTLTEEGDYVVAFWPKRALRVYGSSASDAMAQMQAAQVLVEADYRLTPDMAQPRLVTVTNSDGQTLAGTPMPPVSAHDLIIHKKKPVWIGVDLGESEEALKDRDDTLAPEIADSKIERINGIAIDGKVAYSEGTPAGDCPYSSDGEDEGEYENFERWNAEWDEAADAAEEEEGKSGTVVAEKYRAKYAEAGHPTHCGDWLAETLNEICLNKGGTNLELFEEICGLNGVNTSKYKRAGVGWQGRIRMTGRNLMAKKVFQNNGVLILPQTINGGKMQAPGEWMAQQRFKALPKTDAK